jgi:hypothetical protein
LQAEPRSPVRTKILVNCSREKRVSQNPVFYTV